jgi:hypothetical protein
MGSAGGFCEPAADMIVKRLISAAMLVCIGGLVGSCAGATESGVSGYVADHWPHWAGGMPADVPPRPGAPVYDEFIAHGQADQAATNSATAGAKPAATATVQPVFQSVQAAPPAPAPQTRPVSNPAPEDTGVVKGGLY